MNKKINLSTVMSLYVMLIVVPVLILSGILAYYTIERSQDMQVEEARQNLNTLITTAETNMNSVESLFNTVCFDTKIANFLASEYKADSYFVYKDEIFPRVEIIKNVAASGIVNLSVYMKNETIPEGYEYFRYFSENEWVQKLANGLSGTNGKWVIDEEENGKKLLFLQGIYAPYRDELLAVAVGEVSVEWLLLQNNSAIGDVWVSCDGFLYSTSAEKMPDIVGGYARNDKYVTIQKQLSRLNTDIILRVPNKTPSRVVTSYVVLCVCVLVVSLMIYFFILNRIVKDANHMIKQIQKSVENDFQDYVVSDSKFELSIIADKFNEIVEQIHFLIDDGVEKKLAQREAQIAAMQCQINPHMLCNSLQIIQYQLEMAGQYEISDTVATFGKIMRYGIDDKTIITNVGQEVEHLYSYVEFQKLRYAPGEIDFHIEVEEELKIVSMIKLTLQPLVENALTHGKVKAVPIKIRVRIYRKGDSIHFEVMNTGKKLSESEIQKMNNLLQEKKEDKTRKSIGLQNINRRNILFYSERSMLQVRADVEGNTCIAFEIPYQNKEGC